MSADVLADRPTPAGRAGHMAAAGPPSVGQRFAPDLLGADPVAGEAAGRLHAAWTLATMLRVVARDALALATGPPSAMLAGCSEAWLGPQALDWGFRRVVAIDPDEERRRRVTGWRELLGIEAGRLVVAKPGDTGSSLSTLEPDLAIIDLRGLRGGGEGLLESATSAAPHHAIVTGDPNAAAAAVREAGHPVPRAVRVPADGERRFITEEIVVLSGPRADER
jgi:hypothetical protein